MTSPKRGSNNFTSAREKTLTFGKKLKLNPSFQLMWKDEAPLCNFEHALERTFLLWCFLLTLIFRKKDEAILKIWHQMVTGKWKTKPARDWLSRPIKTKNSFKTFKTCKIEQNPRKSFFPVVWEPPMPSYSRALRSPSIGDVQIYRKKVVLSRQRKI